MKKKFWTGRLKTILIIALVVAICAAVTLAIATGTSALENVVGTILSPIRAGVASIDRLAERYYNYMFRYESLAAENAEMEKQILAMTPSSCSARTSGSRRCCSCRTSMRTTSSSPPTSSPGIPPTTKAPLPSARARTPGLRRVCAP